MPETERQAVNVADFIKMAYGDIEGFRELAGEFFVDVRARQPSWKEMFSRGDLQRLREELHRCKGGASIFGLEQIVFRIRSAEAETALEEQGFDFTAFSRELDEAENRIATITE